jgi:hypothetical protein
VICVHSQLAVALTDGRIVDSQIRLSSAAENDAVAAAKQHCVATFR